MKLAIDGYWWDDGPASLRHVTREIVIAWAQTYPGDEVVVIARNRHARGSSCQYFPNVTIKRIRLYPQALHALIGLPFLARAVKADSILSFNFAAWTNIPSAVFIHDFLFIDHPEWFTQIERIYFSAMKPLTRLAEVIFTSSEEERQRISRLLPSRRVSSVGLGMSTELVNEDPTRPAFTKSLSGFLLTVGRLNHRKNLAATIESTIESGVVSPNRPLIIVGDTSRLPEDLKRYSQHFENRTILFVGHVSSSELVWLYRNCDLFMYLSLGEGFGMPPVEAAYFGARVLVSDAEPFHENLGPWASYVDPKDRVQISAAIVRALRDNQLEPGGLNPTKRAQRVSTRHNWTSVVKLLRAELVRAHNA